MKTEKTLLVFLVLLLSFLTIQAQTWTQIGQDIDGDEDEDIFGCSVSLSADGSVVAIGAREYWYTGTGYVRVFELLSGNWTQIGQDINGIEVEDGFGNSVSLSLNGMVVAIKDMNIPGHVRIYENQNDSWIQIGQDIVDESSSHAGAGPNEVVDLNYDGSIVAVGALVNDANGNFTGHVRIFENQSGSWAQIGQDIDGESVDDYSGSSVDLNSAGSIVAIGAPGNDGNGDGAGHVRLYEYQDGTWVQLGQDIDGESAEDYSGRSVSLSSAGMTVAIGAPGNNDNGYYAGHVRVYEYQNGTWVQKGQDIDGEANEDDSGSSISISSDGSIVAIGAPSNSGNGEYAGHVRVFEYTNETWSQIGQDIDGEVEDSFGSSISLNSNGLTVAIGAPWHYDLYNGNVGKVSVFSFGPSGISTDFLRNQLSVYPNPTDGVFNLDITNKDVESISISNMIGQQILAIKSSLQNITFDLSSYESGIYTISVQTKDDIIMTKIINK